MRVAEQHKASDPLLGRVAGHLLVLDDRIGQRLEFRERKRFVEGPRWRWRLDAKAEAERTGAIVGRMQEVVQLAELAAEP